MPSLSLLLGQQAPTVAPEASQTPAGPSLSKLLSPAAPSAPTNTTGATGAAFSGADMFLRGVTDAASNVLKGGAHLLYGKLLRSPEAEKNVDEGLDLVFDKAKEKLQPQNEFEAKALQEHPHIAGVAGTIGNIGTSTGLVNPVAKAATTALSPALNKAAPLLSANPAVQQAVSQGVLGGSINAALSPDHPISAFLMGAIPSGALGYKEGSLGYKLNRAGQIIESHVQNAIDSGQKPFTPEGLNTIHEELKSNGLVLRQTELKAAVQAKAGQLLDKIRPETYTPEQSPINVISQQAIKNFPEEIKKSQTLYSPINQDQHQFQPQTFNQAVANTKLNPKIHLPDALPENATLNQMLEYRRQLDSTVKQANTLRINGSINSEEAAKVMPLRQALNQDIHQSAASVGLDQQLQQAEQHYNQNIRPFQVFSKNTTDLKNMNPEQAAGKIWHDLSLQFNKPRGMDPYKIKQVAATLGPEGKDLVGWGLIENSYKKANVGGMFNPQMFASNIARTENSGLNELVMTPAHREVVTGLNNIMKGAKQFVPKADQELTTGIVGSLIQSRSGIQLLKTLGSQSPSAVTTRTVLQQLLTGTLSQGIHYISSGVTQPNQDNKGNQ